LDKPQTIGTKEGTILQRKVGGIGFDLKKLFTGDKGA
jgi:hypothetical protein